MTFNPNADIDPSRVTRRSGGRVAGGVSIGGGLGLVALFLISQFLGVDLTGLAGGLTGGTGTQSESSIAGCETGADANASIDCRIAGTAASLDAFWSATLSGNGYQYRSVDSVVLFEGQTSTACGTGSTAMGPFYCPNDQTIYLDTAFFDELRSQFGTSGGPLAEMYVIAHEWGHHIQNVLGTMNSLDLQDSGPTSDSVRLELQADCYAGAWVAAAPTTTDADGDAYIEPPTKEQMADALDAARVVGDDYIQENLGGGSVNPEGWTHGSSESRQKWFSRGHDQGVGGCNTFAAGADL